MWITSMMCFNLHRSRTGLKLYVYEQCTTSFSWALIIFGSTNNLLNTLMLYCVSTGGISCFIHICNLLVVCKFYFRSVQRIWYDYSTAWRNAASYTLLFMLSHPRVCFQFCIRFKWWIDSFYRYSLYQCSSYYFECARSSTKNKRGWLSTVAIKLFGLKYDAKPRLNGVSCLSCRLSRQ